jgi:nucleoside-diphosphate-sugar epimerase
VPDSIALRASIVIGARSRSFRLLVRLVERMPVIALPSWQRFRTQPIDARDVTAMLVAAAALDAPSGSLDIGGPDILTYGEMIERLAELMLVGRPSLRLGVTMPNVSGRLAAAIAGEDFELVGPLMEGLKGDLLPASEDAATLFKVRLHSFDAAVEHALAEWERSEPLAAR